MKTVTGPDAFDSLDVDSPDGYVNAVRSAFGSSLASNEAVLENLMPPLRSLHSVQIEVTTWCNLSCRECSRTKALKINEWENVHISIELLRTIIEKLPRTRSIVLQGVGEPTLHPQFPEMVRLASESKKFDTIVFNTNGLTHDDQYWKVLAQYPEIVIALSVDSLDPVVAEQCRAGTNVDKLWERLNLFRRNFNNFNVALVASRINLRDIETTLRKVASVGVPVRITPVISNDAGVVMTREDEAFLAERVRSVRNDHPNYSVHFDPLDTELSGKGKRCVAPFLSPYVRADGYLTPCCVAVSPSHYGLTRADDERSWDALREERSVVKWVSDFVASDPEICQGCSLNPARSSYEKPGDDIISARRPRTLPISDEDVSEPVFSPLTKAASAFYFLKDSLFRAQRRRSRR